MSLGEQFSYAEKATSILNDIRILVVDDNEGSRVLLRYIFEDYGAVVLAVESVQKALAAIKQWQPNLLISDIGIPHENGYSLMRKVRSLKAEHGGQIPAIAITGYARDLQPLQPSSTGFQLHLTKPIDPEGLVVAAANLVK